MISPRYDQDKPKLPSLDIQHIHKICLQVVVSSGGGEGFLDLHNLTEEVLLNISLIVMKESQS